MKDYDRLIRGGRIVDGTGNPYYIADIGVAGGMIARIGRGIDPESAKEVVSAEGLTVCPGFIDTHTHDEGYLFFKPSCDEKVRQGVTTVVTGNCGFSLAPISPERGSEMKAFLGLLGAPHLPEAFWSGLSMGALLDHLAAVHPGINVVPLVGHQTIRIQVMGMDCREAEASEIEEMKVLAGRAMAEGAFGLSTGLNYAPGSFASFGELAEILGVVGEYGGLYATHMRDESSRQREAIEETLGLARQAGVRAHISHHKVMGKPNWGQSEENLRMIEAAREAGLEVTCDQYPYTAASTFLAAALPLEFQSGGPDVFAEKLRDPEVRRALIDQFEHPAREGAGSLSRDVGLENVIISGTRDHPEYTGRSLVEIGEAEGRSPYDVFFDLVMTEKMDVTMVVFMMDEGDIRRIMGRPFTMIGSDSIPDFGTGNTHPRFSGTFPRVLGRYVRELGALELEDAIRKMTSLPARTFGLKNKGLVMEGFDADLVVFDPRTIEDRATYKEPTLPPRGIHHVWVNGEPAVKGGRVTGATSGRVFRRS